MINMHSAANAVIIYFWFISQNSNKRSWSGCNKCVSRIRYVFWQLYSYNYNILRDRRRLYYIHNQLNQQGNGNKQVAIRPFSLFRKKVIRLCELYEYIMPSDIIFWLWVLVFYSSFVLEILLYSDKVLFKHFYK